MIDYYNKAIEIVGELPPQYEVIYAIVTVILIIATVVVFLSPLLVLKVLGGNR